MSELLGLILIGLGLAFNMLGCIGLVRMPDVYNRLQAATKCVTLGTCSILIGTLFLTGISATGLKAFLCALFVLLTAPVAAHAISRGTHHSGTPLAEGSIRDDYLKAEEDSRALEESAGSTVGEKA